MIHFEAARRRAHREYQARAWHAWHSAAFQRAERMPPLDSVLGTKAGSEPERQSWQQQRDIARMMNGLMGGTVRRAASG